MSLVWLFMILTVVPHELAHAIVVRLLGYPVKLVVIGMGPILMRRKFFGLPCIWRALPFGGWVLPGTTEKPMPLPGQFIVSAAGPGVHLLMALAVWVFLPADYWTSLQPVHRLEFAAAFITANVLEFVFNTVPRRFDSDTGPAVTDGMAMCQILFLRRAPFVPDPYKPHPLRRAMPVFWLAGLAGIAMCFATWEDTASGKGIPWRPALWLLAGAAGIQAAVAVSGPDVPFLAVKPGDAAQSPQQVLHALMGSEFQQWRKAPEPSPQKQQVLQILAAQSGDTRKQIAALPPPDADEDDAWLLWMHYQHTSTSPGETPAGPPPDAACDALEWPALRAAAVIARCHHAARQFAPERLQQAVDDFLASDPPAVTTILVRHMAAAQILTAHLTSLIHEALEWSAQNLGAVPGDPFFVAWHGAALISAGSPREGTPLLSSLKPGISPDEAVGPALLFLAIAARSEGNASEATTLAAAARRHITPGSLSAEMLVREFPHANSLADSGLE